MARAFVDTSWLVSIALGERGSAGQRRRLDRFTTVLASGLLEAELHAALLREGVEGSEGLTRPLSWIMPRRPLEPEIGRVLAAGFLRGADCWHLATALYAAGEPADLTFLTLDQRQRAIASALGFAT